ncbi:hypothetical protein [uncultured Kordia sp.]|uniref:hypothetical protein n=1 Tax=uncultured Kordia sp. TaxID=507699 RepID=UPI00261204D9|nr:hypothetical protein [uncultured Kordia sp.]
MKSFFVFILMSFLGIANVFSQEFDSNYTTSTYTHYKHKFYVHSFNMGNSIKTKYFSKNANTRYLSWQKNKKVMLICAGAFSETWKTTSKPVGLTVDAGNLINSRIDPTMDGLVIVKKKFIFVMDLDKLESGFTLDDGSKVKINPRKSSKDKFHLLKAAREEKYTIFQTQLVYSKDKIFNFRNLHYGKKRERRFLATAFYNNDYYNIIVDVPDYLPLNQSAKYAKEVLDYIGYDVQYILNLDTGGKNIFLIRKDDKNLTYKATKKLKDATNLIVFYR